MFVSRDVVFHEDIFPFHQLPSKESFVDPFPDLVIPKPILKHSPSTLPPPEQPSSSPTPIMPSPKWSARVVKPPSYLRDYRCHLLTHQSDASHSHSEYPLSKYIAYNSLSPSHKTFALTILSHFEPHFYHQAVKYPQLKEAMKAELEAMETNKTWSVVYLPPGKHIIGCKWIDKIKYKSDGSIERHKAKLVAKGYTQ